ncbi:hypothetical protein LIER_15919 [Lithospermum erythrorhizon]|uniref:Uncharacterized protein n=1 Tax=Lithospermum erythrorhizon TaxID=34254 RepID=A0AAV3Q4L6_LITER
MVAPPKATEQPDNSVGSGVALLPNLIIKTLVGINLSSRVLIVRDRGTISLRVFSRLGIRNGGKHGSEGVRELLQDASVKIAIADTGPMASLVEPHW